MSYDDLKRKSLADAIRKAVRHGRSEEFFGRADTGTLDQIVESVTRGDDDLGRMFIKALDRDRVRRGMTFDEHVKFMGEEAKPAPPARRPS